MNVVKRHILTDFKKDQDKKENNIKALIKKIMSQLQNQIWI